MVKFNGKILLLLLVLLFATSASKIKFLDDSQNGSELLNISDYDYPKPEPEGSGLYTIAIVGTNDIHGAAFPNESKDMVNDVDYEYGGLEYMSTQIKALLAEWKDRILLLDGGDEYQGGYENVLSKGDIISLFFNNLRYDAAAIGNHEFDFGQEFLHKRVEKAEYQILASNIFNNKTDEDVSSIFPQAKQTKMFTVGKVKIGVIGLTTNETTYKTSGNLTGIKFEDDYKLVIEKQAKFLREKGANAVVLTTHIGMQCDLDDMYVLRVKSKEELDFSKCKGDVIGEMPALLKSLEPGTIDGIVGGHVHAINKHWVNGVPFMSNNNSGRYFNIMYLTFDLRSSNKIQYLKEKTKIEGPVPVCQKVFEKNRICELFSETEDQGQLHHYTFHGRVIYKDYTLSSYFEKMWEELKPFKIPLTKSTTFMRRSKEGNYVLGNYFCDCINESVGSDFSVFNYGGFRTVWNPGKITEYVFKNMFPFPQDVVSTLMKGKEFKKLLITVQAVKNEFLAVGGMQNFYKKTGVEDKKQELVKIIDLKTGQEIEDEKTYKFASLSYLLGDYGDAFRLVKGTWKPELKTEGTAQDIFRECLKRTEVLTKDTGMSPIRNVYNRD